ncbi:YcxB family protein [Butyrivibrio sp. MC2021]|uniref:YcxB family protein n=1 Tax=Butyrivibrio sp. MC2021 TaxID=1408306 RepID=UPI00047AA03F|nr:YcxB family protein [Butyrivibrio sp. MC2021]
MLFQTETKWTFDEFAKMNWVIFKKRYIRKFVIVGILFILMMLLEAALYSMYKVTGFTSERVIFLIVPPLLVLILPGIRYLQMKKNVEQAYYSNKRLQDVTTHFSFYEDRVETKSELGNGVIRYEDLYKLIETKENFYLCVASNQASVIIKNNCSEELIAFLHEKVSGK